MAPDFEEKLSPGSCREKENDLVVATFGRGIYVTDISPLQELNEKVLTEEIHLFVIEPKAQRIARSFGANDYLFW